MATKTKPEVKPQKYTSWPQINIALAQLKAIRADHDRLAAKLKTAVGAAQLTHGVPAEVKANEALAIELGIGLFLHERKEQLMGEDGNRTLELENGKVGLRWGPPKLATLSKITWEKVLSTALAMPARIRSIFVKEEASIDKKALLKAIREGAITEDVRRELGVDARQEEYAVIELA